MTDVALCRGLHQAIRTLRGGDNEIRVTGESGTAKKTDSRHNGMGTAKVNDSSIETMWEDSGGCDSVNKNIQQDRKVEDNAPAIAMQMDGRLTREERDAILLGNKSYRQEQEKPLIGFRTSISVSSYSLSFHPRRRHGRDLQTFSTSIFGGFKPERTYSLSAPNSYEADKDEPGVVPQTVK